MKYEVHIEINHEGLTLNFSVEVEASSEEEADRKGRDILLDSASIWSEDIEDYGSWEDDDDTSWLEEGEDEDDDDTSWLEEGEDEDEI